MRVALASCASLPAWEVDDRPLVAALEERGATVRAVAWDDPAADWSAFDACLIRTTWDYQERREDFVRWAERAGSATRLFNPPDVVRWNTHKGYLRELEAAGTRIVPSAFLARGERVDLARLLAERGWTRGFVKPAIGANARGTLRFDAGTRIGAGRAGHAGLAAAAAHLEALLAREDALVQPYYASVETRGELSAIFVDGAFTHAVRKVPVPGDYRVQDDFGASDERAELGETALAAAREVVARAAAGLLYARVDFLWDDDGALRLNELELVEPSLFFRHAPEAAVALAEALLGR